MTLRVFYFFSFALLFLNESLEHFNLLRVAGVSDVRGLEYEGKVGEVRAVEDTARPLDADVALADVLVAVNVGAGLI